MSARDLINAVFQREPSMADLLTLLSERYADSDHGAKYLVQKAALGGNLSEIESKKILMALRSGSSVVKNELRELKFVTDQNHSLIETRVAHFIQDAGNSCVDLLSMAL